MMRTPRAPCSLCSVACFSPPSMGQWEQGLVPTSPPPGQLGPCSCPRPAVSAPAAFAGSLGPVGPEGWPLVIPGFLTSGSLRVIVHNFPVGPGPGGVAEPDPNCHPHPHPTAAWLWAGHLTSRPRGPL